MDFDGVEMKILIFKHYEENNFNDLRLFELPCFKCSTERHNKYEQSKVYARGY